MRVQSDKDSRPEFMDCQYAFAAHIRDPQQVPIPEDVEDRRMGIYRELLYNNVQDFMASGFPVLRRLYRDDDWHAMIRDYFARHKAHTPLFPQMPREFLTYLESERGEHPEDPPFLTELAHYEWVELALSVDEREIDLTHVDPDGDLLLGVPILSPLAWPLAYRYPVHRISTDFRPEQPPEQATYLVVYRDREDDVGFLELNPVTARLLALLSLEDPLTGETALRRIAEELGHPDPGVVTQGGLQTLVELKARDVVLGTRRA